ncbi:MAG: peroxidase, partial [Ktedonobacteraceae bacterium]
MTTEARRPLELDDIQNGVLHPRPFPYVATYILLRIDDRRAGREMLRLLIPDIASAADPTSPDRDAWLSVALTYQGLKALGVPQASLDSFTPEFQEGMAARAALLGDVGESSPALWEKPLGTPDVHVLLTAISPDT